jgi:hypothetical protein
VKIGDLAGHRPFLSVECEEKGKILTRHIRRLENNGQTASYLFHKLKGLPSVFSNQPMETAEKIAQAMKYDTRIFAVDDVGIIVVAQVESDVTAHVHITFWDKRLRGRENLCIEMADLIQRLFQLQFLWTAIPVSSAATVAFAKRVGFKIQDYIIGGTTNVKGEVDDMYRMIRF